MGQTPVYGTASNLCVGEEEALHFEKIKLLLEAGAELYTIGEHGSTLVCSFFSFAYFPSCLPDCASDTSMIGNSFMLSPATASGCNRSW